MPAEGATTGSPVAEAGELERQAPRSWPDGFAKDRVDRRALLVLACLRGITPARLLELASRVGTASGCLAVIRAGRAGSDGDMRFAREADPDELEAALRACEARVAMPGVEEYVAALGELPDPPAAIFLRGRLLRPGHSRVAIVGARRCTAAGAEVARRIARGLAAAGVSIVSGAAQGIDRASHEGALDAGGRTIAVLGSGIDRAYPPSSRSLVGRLAMQGTLVSEYPPGVPAEAFRFPARNRIVAALGGAVVIVEGAERSGSLITAGHATELGRQVFAVPGSVTNPLAEVPLALIRDGATLIRGAGDLLDDLRTAGLVAPAGAVLGNEDDEDGPPPGIDALEAAVLHEVTESVLPENVARTVGLSLPEAVACLMRLELKGLVRSVGGRFNRRG